MRAQYLSSALDKLLHHPADELLHFVPHLLAVHSHHDLVLGI